MADTKKKFYSCGFLYDPVREAVLLHHRDGNTQHNPNKWSLFGGTNEEGETPMQCFLRELNEEIGLKLPEAEAHVLRDYLNVNLDTHRYVFYSVRNDAKEKLTLGEGAGFDWVPIAELQNYDLTGMTADDLRYFIVNVKPSL